MHQLGVIAGEMMVIDDNILDYLLMCLMRSTIRVL